jgi:hypothetical protein
MLILLDISTKVYIASELLNIDSHNFVMICRYAYNLSL